MNKDDLKKLMLPLVRECVREVLVKELLIKEVVSQLNEGFRSPQQQKPIPAQKIINSPELKQKRVEEMKEKYQEAQRSLEEATGLKGMFPVSILEEEIQIEEPTQEEMEDEAPVINENKKKTYVDPKTRAIETQAPSSLKGIAPHDPGVNINGIMNLVGGKSTWKKVLKTI